ncbi:FMN-binding negative transcriptional regulator [Rossellomorea aquimaris]|uniref:FMN-binding negative transcriptional regulator n=1 Tax=Rossellomorea aquimaris TaxID=189382 RepID=UPI001CD5002E|nr:FMN-binding negative transcriptional regulator [Rossellomorea aquimaris]MCA1055561.1 FMN-binding negative transcriptional regulator [Rossellomorea aquimaris]
MYIPKEFTLTDRETIFKIIEENSFATLISQLDGRPWATHLPLELSVDRTSLRGHFAKANPQWHEAFDQEILVVFGGAHAYISPSWYESDQTVPTWNYVSVHVYGKIMPLTDDADITDVLSSLVKKYEKPDSPYSLDKVSDRIRSGLQKGIVPFEITITSIEAKAKLSQNHSIERQSRVIEQLEKSQDENSLSIASMMKENIIKRTEGSE